MAPARIGFHPLPVAEVCRLTDDAVGVTFEVPPELRAAYDFVPGQYLTIRPGPARGGSLRRYSICSPAAAGVLQIGVKRRPGGTFSRFVVEDLRPGDVLDVMTPMGGFVAPLDPRRPRHYAGVAVGSGITPLRSIVTSVLAHEPGSRVTLLYANRDRAATMFLDDLADLAAAHPGRFTLVCTFSAEAGTRLTADGVAAFAADHGLVPAADVWYLCGPYALTEAFGERLAAESVPTDRVRLESFKSRTASPRTSAPGTASRR